MGHRSRHGSAEATAESGSELRPSGDQTLVDAFLRGEPAAVESVGLWIRQAAWRYRDRLASEWDDLQQDLIVEVTTVFRDSAFRGESTLRTFVSRIVHYRCLNRIRDRSRRPESELGDQVVHLPDPARTKLDRLVEKESEDLLKRFLNTVDDDCRHLWKAILEGHSYRQMSEATGVSEGALRVRVRRCRQKALTLWRRWLASDRANSGVDEVTMRIGES